jgi:hypothetical protein
MIWKNNMKKLTINVSEEDYNYIQAFSKVMFQGDKVIEEYLRYAIQCELAGFFELSNTEREQIEIEMERMERERINYLTKNIVSEG